LFIDGCACLKYITQNNDLPFFIFGGGGVVELDDEPG
jgi:hypothetical protein